MNFTRMMNQKLTYWAPTGDTNRYGKAVWSDPVVLNCRWEEKTSEVINKKGEEIISKTRVYVIESVKIDGFVYLGESTEEAPVEGSFEIQQVGTTPDLRNLKQLVTVYL